MYEEWEIKLVRELWSLTNPKSKKFKIFKECVRLGILNGNKSDYRKYSIKELEDKLKGGN